eukprot:scaffold1998_cov209-Pinguiococcus_pyrenoidosus.AAC.1
MVESVVYANHVIPCTLLLLPQAMARKLRDHFAKGGKDDDDDEHLVWKWRQLKRAISTRTSLCSKPLYLYFFCPVSGKIMRSNGGRGFKFFMPREWFSAASPYLRPISAILNFSIFAVGTALGLTALAVSICRALELPGKFGMNDRFAGDVGLAATGASLIERLEKLPEEASEEDKELRQQIEKPDDGSFDPANPVLQNPEAVGGDNYGRVIEMLKELGATAELGKLLKRSLRPALAILFLTVLVEQRHLVGSYGAVLGTGLVLACGPTGEFMWVSEDESKKAFEKHGLDVVLPSVRETLPDHFRRRSENASNGGCEEKKGSG